MFKSVALTILSFYSFFLTAQVLPVTFSAEDGIPITGNYYPGETSDAPIIILCHQAGWSLGEYQEIAPKLTQRGYSCLAIDQRSGGEINGVKNKTHQQAEEKNKSTNYLDAKQDIVAAINFAKESFPKKTRLILWGSSYSAALAIVIGATNDDVDAIISFSPGEYFERFGKTDHFIADAASKCNKPIFITSSKGEVKDWAQLFENIPTENKTGFIPKGKGKHGSRNLWEKFDDHQEYWDAVEAFLMSL